MTLKVVDHGEAMVDLDAASSHTGGATFVDLDAASSEGAEGAFMVSFPEQDLLL